MLVRQPRLGFDRRGTDDQWSALVASIGLTGALFAAAFVSMRAAPDWTDRTAPESTTRPVVVQLPALPAPVPPPAVPRRIVPPTPTNQPAPTTVPVGVSPSVSAPAPVTAPVTRAAPSAPPSNAPRDSGVSVESLLHPGRAAAENAIIGAPNGRGAPVAPAGVTIHNAPLPAYVLDSIAGAKLAETAELALMRKTAREDKQRLEESQRQAVRLQQRATTAGNSRDIAVPMGKGVDGVGAVGGPGMVSIGVPLFSSGPSAAQRKKNEQLDAEYQLRLRRLQDRAAIGKDSARLDSLRRDSLARKRRPPER